MARIEEYQNFVINLKSFCERDIYIHSQNLAYTAHSLGYCEARKDLNEHILHLISLLDTNFYDYEIEEEEH